LTIAAVTLRAQSEAAKTAALPTSSSVAARPSRVCPSILSTIRCRPSRRANLVGYLRELGLGAPGEKDARPLASEGARDSAADRPTPAVDHSVLAFEQHRVYLLASLVS
jgi:hypothetical protein